MSLFRRHNYVLFASSIQKFPRGKKGRKKTNKNGEKRGKKEKSSLLKLCFVRMPEENLCSEVTVDVSVQTKRTGVTFKPL